jgi:hypothetical protein
MANFIVALFSGRGRVRRAPTSAREEQIRDQLALLFVLVLALDCNVVENEDDDDEKESARDDSFE